MKREYLLLSLSTLISCAVAAFILSFFFPQLFGRPQDLNVVQLDKKLPPFYEGVFRTKDYVSPELILKDPVTNVRGKPLFPELGSLGPHDILGFRNTSIPNVADVVTIGDSQTYGINVIHNESWPQRLSQKLGGKKVYSMAIGGWSPPQYLAIYEKALTLQPQAVVIGIYLGNDILEAFRVVYSHSYWAKLRKKDLSLSDAPTTPFPFPESELLSLNISDNDSMIFTPAGRLRALDQRNRANEEGMRLIIECMKQISLKAQATKTPTIFLLIPTKELVYKQLIEEHNESLHKDFDELWKQEQEIHDTLLSQGKSLSSIEVHSTLSTLREALSQHILTYRSDKDGHPLAHGYSIISDIAHDAIKERIYSLASGLYQTTVGDKIWFFQVREGKRTLYRSEIALKKTGLKKENAVPTSLGRLQHLPLVNDHH